MQNTLHHAALIFLFGPNHFAFFICATFILIFSYRRPIS